MRIKIVLLLAIITTSFQGDSQTKRTDQITRRQLKQFAAELESLRSELKIPGMSAVIVKDQQVIWKEGFGFADIEHNIKATANTPYRIASLTKPIATTLFLQLLEQGKVALDDPIKKYYPKDFETESVHVRHILTHTAGVSTLGGKPGDKYAYSGAWFGYLGPVIAKGADTTFRDQLVAQILQPLHMDNSVPGQDVLMVKPSPVDHYPSGTRTRYENTLARLAKPYTLYGEKENILSPYPPKMISSAAGLISTVTDLAKFDVAIDQYRLIKKETQDLAWTQSLTNTGEKIPYGLGWFVQEFNGMKLVWHYGQWPVFSGLYLKIPEKKITLILLANSSGLSAPFDMDKGDVLVSPFALAFLKTFIGKDTIELKERELKAHTSINTYLQSRIARVRKEIKLDPTMADNYVGKYALDTINNVIIGKNQDQLTLTYPGQPTIDLFPESETDFFVKIASIQVIFVKDPNGKINELKLIQSGKEKKAKR